MTNQTKYIITAVGATKIVDRKEFPAGTPVTVTDRALAHRCRKISGMTVSEQKSTPARDPGDATEE